MRRIIEPKRVDMKGDWGNCVMKSVHFVGVIIV
jgi:hypothetical protein